MQLKNRVQLIGNLGQLPVICITENGKKMARFSIVTHDTYRNTQGEKVTDTLWHNIVAWGKLAEIAEKHFTKGREVAVSGKIVHRSYTDKNGIHRQITEIILYELLLLGRYPKFQNEPGGEINHDEHTHPDEES